MSVPARHILVRTLLAAAAFGVAALGFALMPAHAGTLASCNCHTLPACKTQIKHHLCNERSPLQRFGRGDKMALFCPAETQFTGAMTMDAGVGQSLY